MNRQAAKSAKYRAAQKMRLRAAAINQ